MSVNKAHRAFDLKNYKAYAAAKPADATPPITYGAYSTTTAYLGNNMAPARGNADDNLLYLSLFTGPARRCPV